MTLPISRTSMLLDFGLQPICNRFPAGPDETEARFPLALALDERNGLILLHDPIPVNEIRPRVDWITYREPEGHLDMMVKRVASAAALKSGARILGLSVYDASTIDRFRRLGYSNAACLDPNQDLGIDLPRAGMESIQARVRPDAMAEVAKKIGHADLISARFALEHAHDLGAFCSGLAMLLKENGMIVFEVPDFSTSLQTGEYSNIWEEHAAYFTPQSLQRLMAACGFATVAQESYSYPLEDSIVTVVTRGHDAELFAVDAERECERARAYAAAFPRRRRQVRACLERLNSEGQIAIFGAGHLATKFLNFMDVADLVSFVVDDHPEKCGLLMPGSRLSIRPSSALLQEPIRWCLLSLSPESEERVISRMVEFSARGGEVYSIFAASSRRIPL